MPYIKVNIAKIKNYSSEIASFSTSVRSIKENFNDYAGRLDWDVKSSSNINNRINAISRELETELSSCNKMQSFLLTAAGKYDELEGNRTGSSSEFAASHTIGGAGRGGGGGGGEGSFSGGGEGSFGGGGGGMRGDTDADNNSSTWKKVGKFMSKLGFFGTAISGLINMGPGFDVGGGAKTVVDVAKGGKDLIKGLFDWKKAAKNRDGYARFGNATAAKDKFWKSAFGLDDIFKGKASRFRANWTKAAPKSGLKGTLSALGTNLKTGLGKGWGTRFSRNFSKNMKTQVGKYTQGAKSAFSWLGVGLNLAGNAISNIEEGKEEGHSTGRIVAETITETVVDTATGWVVGAAVAAGVAATIGSAPVLVVGAATVGITMGLDYACKKITGAITGTEKGLSETISDAVLDVGTAAVKGMKKIGNFFGSLFKK